MAVRNKTEKKASSMAMTAANEGATALALGELNKDTKDVKPIRIYYILKHFGSGLLTTLGGNRL